MPRIKVAPPRVPPADSRRVKPPGKTPDPIYATPEHRAWRAAVIQRAGHRCEWVESGLRCIKGEPYDRLFADHVVELRDGGALFDPSNGMALCGSHHTLKTVQSRVDRFRG
jgi:5-methylcytosine-specific restriction enzyme A